MKKVVFIGGVGKPDEFVGGELTKNKNILAALTQFGRDVRIVDTYGMRKHPYRLFTLLFALFADRNAPVLVSTNLSNIYWLFVVLSKFGSKRVVSFVATGGSFSKKVLEGRFNAKYLKFLHIILVQGKKMQNELSMAGLTNHALLLNCKYITHIPCLSPAKRGDDIVRFVFVSRMHYQKGVGMILNCCRKLNEMKLTQQYTMTFYGDFSDDVQCERFVLPIIDSMENVEYKGVLNLRCDNGYDELATYDVMLFPSFWRGEGFPGIAIDALIAGLPIIISDWNFNKEVIVHGETGFIIPARDENALLMQMLDAIDNPSKYSDMREECQKNALKYNASEIFSESLFLTMGL